MRPEDHAISPAKALRRCARRAPQARQPPFEGITWVGAYTAVAVGDDEPRQLRLGAASMRSSFGCRANQPQSLEARTAVRQMAQRVDMMGPPHRT